MASVSESCNAVHGNSSASQDKVGLMPAFYQVLVIWLKDPDKKYQEKVGALLRAWETLASYTNQSSLSDNINSLTEHLYRDTLKLVLRGEWTKLPQANKTHLNVTLQKTATNLSNTPAYHLCQHVIHLVKTPWEDPVLSKIIQGNSDINDSEALEFCLAEKPVLLTIRLEMLCDSKCEDLALKLVVVCRRCLQHPSDSRFLESCSASQQEQWLDLHVALLYRFKKKKEEFVTLLKELSLEEGYKLVKRFVDKGTLQTSQMPNSNSSNRIWRNSLKIAELASQCLLTTALIRCPPPSCLSSLAIQLVKLQKTLGKSNQAVIEMMHTLVDHNKLVTSAHMYILCEALITEFRDDFRSLCIEMYVRAVAVDLNDLEKRKLHPEEGGIKSAEIGLATAFSSLADLVCANLRICRECALTAFSLHPTKCRFDKLVELAALTHEQISKLDSTTASLVGEVSVPSPSVTVGDCQGLLEHSRDAVVGEPPPGGGVLGGVFNDANLTNGSGHGEDGCPSLSFTSVKEALEDADSGVDLCDVTNGAGEQEASSPCMVSQEEETSPYSVSAAASLGVSEAVISDLATVVHSWRWDVLSWKLGWEELEPLCRRYMAEQEKMRSVTKELLFLNIDYSQFKDMPRPERDEFWGIEKGYENYIEGLSDSDERSRPRVKTEKKRQKPKPSDSRPASGSSSPYPGELSKRKKVLKKKLMRKVTLSLKTSSDSDSSIGFHPSNTNTESKSTSDGVKRSARIKACKKTTSPRGSTPLVKKLRAIRPDFGIGNQWPDSCSTTQNVRSLCELADLTSNNLVQHSQVPRCPSSLSSTSSSPCHNAAADHFAPMLSTLDMQPKVILMRTPVNSPGPSPVKKSDSDNKMVQATEGILRPYVLLEKLDKLDTGLERTMKNLKGLDMFQVRPPPTAVHMVQLPNPPINSRIVTSNGLSATTEGNGNGGVNNNGNAASDHHQDQQQQQEEASKATTSSGTASTSNSDDIPTFSSSTNVEITAATSSTGTVRNDPDPDPVTLVSTPSVSIFQVAHRPAGNNSGAVLQPIATVTGFNPPNPRVKTPTVTSRSPKGSRGSTTAAAAVRADDMPPMASSITLSQLLAQSPSVDSTEANSPQPQPVASSNGPNQTTGTTPTPTKQSTARSSRAQRARGDHSIPPSPSDGALVSSTVSVPSSSPLPSDISSPCRVPLVKYVDLDMVSSPSRPRPGSTTGVRRHSQGSNSNSPDPHRSNTNKSQRGAGQNPSSPALNSPQSPALQAPPSPLSFRKQQQHHHVYRQQEGKVGTGDRLASPSHPSQCSSPFSRPSSRSQDTSPSPSEVLGGSMYPPGFMPYNSSGDVASNTNHPSTSPSPGASASASRLSNYGGASPSQSSSASNFPSALPKFGQAFGKKSHFDVIPVLGAINTPPPTTSTSLPPINSLQDPNLQVGRMINSNLAGNNFGENTRRFAGEQPNQTDEVEGLGSKLHSLLESALNGQISRSPTRSLPQTQQLVTGNPEMLLSDSAHSISPLVGGMDSQSGSEMAGSGASLSEQLREFESVFERVAASTGSSHLQNQPDPWPELAHPDDGSYMGVGPVEFLAPSSTFSESMDVSEASPTSPNSAEGPPSAHPDESGSGAAGSTDGKGGAPLMQLLTVASAARQALADEEKENENAVHSPPVSTEIKIEPVAEEGANDEADENKEDHDERSSDNQQIPSQLATRAATRVVVLPAVLTGSIVVSTAETGQQPVISSTSTTASPSVSTAVKSEPSTKNTRNKIGNKSSPVVSPGVSGGSSPSKTTATATATTTSSASPAAAKAPQKAHDDEHTVLRVQAILEEYKEQLRNSPDLQNKPAPRRRSNPLPSPNATPKRRKSVQSKVKLLSQHARPAEGTSDGTPNPSSSAESTPTALGESANAESTSNATPAANVETVKTEPTMTTGTTTVVVKAALPEATKTEGTPSVQVLNSSSGIQLSIPVSAVVTSRTGGLAIADGTVTAIATGTTTVTVSSASATPLTSLAGVSTVPISMLHQQLLVQAGTGGVRQLLFPLNFSAARGGASPRYIQVRQVTMSGQPGVISFPTRFGTPITMRAVPHATVSVTQPGQPVQQEQITTTPVVMPTSKQTPVSTGGDVVISSETPNPTQPVPNLPSDGSGLQKVPATTGGSTSTTSEPESTNPVEASSAIKSEAVAVVSVPTSTTASVLRLVPTVNRVNLPVPSAIDANALLTTTPSRVETPSPAPPIALAAIPVNPPPTAVEAEEADHNKWSDQGTPSGSRNSVDGSVTPAAEEKLLNDTEAGVSEFLPCADFMGPGVSPSPCFSLSDSPLGSQNSSPATSPATFQASSTEEDSNGLIIPGDGDHRRTGNSKKLSKAKILKRNVKPRMVVVRKDHGGMEYRRMSDGEGGPAVIRSDRRPLGKRLANKQAAAAAAAAAASAASPLPVKPASRPASPAAPSPASVQPPTEDCELEKPVAKAVRLLIKKEGEVVSSKTTTSSSPNKHTEVVVVELPETVRRSPRDITATSAALNRANREAPVKDEPLDEEDTSAITAPTDHPVEMEDYIVRPRRCGRLQKEEVLKHDSDACPLEHGVAKTKRRSSVRTNVKKNCPCCVTVSERRKRTKSEPPNAEHTSPEQTSPAKKSAANTATSCAPAIASPALHTVSASSPALASSRPKMTKKYAQRKR